MQKKALLALLLALMMTLSGCALIQKDLDVDRATEIIHVGDTVITKGEIQDELNYQLSYMSYYYNLLGLSYDPTDPQNISDMQDSVIEMLIQDAVLNAKAAELGMDQLTDEEMAEVTANADTSWESNREAVQTSYFADSELEGDELEAAIDAQLAELDVKYDDILTSAKQQYALQKLQDSIYATVSVTDDELQERLDANIESAKTTYESNLSSYGSAVNNGTTVYYRPAGYRMVKQILIQFSDEDQADIDEWQAGQGVAMNTLSSEIDVLTNLGVENIDELAAQIQITLDPETGDVTEATPAFSEDVDLDEATIEALTEYAKANTQSTFFLTKYNEAVDNAFAHIDAEADEVLEQLKAGADWDTLAAEHNDDPGMQEGSATAETGYAVCEGFYDFDSAFTEAAMALPKVGTWSDKIKGTYGYYIIQYTSDVEEGPVTLDEVRDTLEADVLSEKQSAAYDEQVNAWVEEANAKVDRKALNK